MIKRLSGCIREYKRDTILTPLFVSVEVVIDIIIPLLMAMMVDNGISKGDMNYIIKIGIALFICAMLALAFGILSAWCAAYASAGFAKNVRHDIFHKVQEFSFTNIDRFSTASLITRTTTDVASLQNSFQMLTRIAVRCPLMIIFALIMTFSINPRLSLIFFAVVPVLGGGLLMIIKNVHPLFERGFAFIDRLNRIVQENLRNIRVVKAFVREEHEINKFKAATLDVAANFTRAEKILALNAPLMQLCMNTCTLLISWFGARFIVSNSLTTGELMSLITYAQQILMSLSMLSMVFVMITMSRASAKRIMEVFNEKVDIVSPENPITRVEDGSIRFENVNFSYASVGGKMALKDVNLDIASGQTVGIIGGTGSAKSTLVQLIPRLYDATEGSVYVGGQDVRRYDLETLRRSVAMVLQNNELFSGTIKENLRWGDLEAPDEELTQAASMACADEFIRSFPQGYDTYIEQSGTNVSGGQKQRLCIARALLKKPQILILDDSTSAVDTQTDARIQHAFKTYIPQTTKIIIAQRISSVQHADQIIVLDDGRVNAVGTHESLLETCAIYQEVYYSQLKGDDSNDAA